MQEARLQRQLVCGCRRMDPERTYKWRIMESDSIIVTNCKYKSMLRKGHNIRCTYVLFDHRMGAVTSRSR
jgi:hypothetical protein